MPARPVSDCGLHVGRLMLVHGSNVTDTPVMLHRHLLLPMPRSAQQQHPRPAQQPRCQSLLLGLTQQLWLPQWRWWFQDHGQSRDGRRMQLQQGTQAGRKGKAKKQRIHSPIGMLVCRSYCAPDNVGTGSLQCKPRNCQLQSLAALCLMLWP